MTEASIPVNLLNPGQVLACLGFLEAADELCKNAEGGFHWCGEAEFVLHVDDERNPFETVLEFLSTTDVQAIAPVKWHPKKMPKNLKKLETEIFPCKSPDTDSALPVLLSGQINSQQKKSIVLSHWADSSSRSLFKLYSGNRSALGIINAMLFGGSKTKGLSQLWKDDREELITNPFDVLTPMGGSFNFDPRGAWTSIDAGYSPDKQNHKVIASPAVEILAAWGIEHVRPKEQDRKVCYTAWGSILSPMLARVAFSGSIDSSPQKKFSFKLSVSGKNKVVTFAQEESSL